MVAFGFGEVIGGLLLGFFIDIYGSKKASLLNVLIIIILISVTLISIMQERYNWITFAMCFFWGV